VQKRDFLEGSSGIKHSLYKVQLGLIYFSCQKLTEHL